MPIIRFAITIILGLTTVSAAVFGETKIEPGAKANRLLKAASPYLRQHAYNPVDWHTWGHEAFEKARREKKPIFLSVGYATCYWCHVMARESFANDEVAKALNAHTIPVKVDRERRPDVDATYMLATELISQQGGWPNSVFLTPDLKPFYGFGYVPRPQLLEVIERVANGWKDQRPIIKADAERVAGLIAAALNRRADEIPITRSVLRRASMHMLARFDVFNGGLGTAPKFPQENVIQFLLHRAERDNDKVSGEAALLTLDNMIRGGIHDHVGGGFHRYATDNAWAIPHFEKMLYNQALTTRALLKAYQLTGYKRYARAARSTLDFVLEHMAAPDGGLASAFDAETDGVEGLFYLWTTDQAKTALGPDMAFAEAVFGITKNGNHEGHNTLRLVTTRDELAASQKMTRQAFDKRVTDVLAKLRIARDKRKPLIRDDKVLTGWNALMVRALAEASIILGEPRYLKAAVATQTFILDKLGGASGDLKRSYFEGGTSLAAAQSDYAFAGLAATALYDATGEKRWLDNAALLAGKMAEHFEDTTNGGLFLTREATGFTRTKETDDSTIPSGNAAALELFARLMQRTPDVIWKQRTRDLQAALSGVSAAEPVGHAATLLAADLATRGENGAHLAALHGAVRVDIERSGDGRAARVQIKLAPGWHLNSIKPLQDFLLPTSISIDGVAPGKITYPAAVTRKLGFHDEPLSLYEGKTEIRAVLPEGDAGRSAHRIRLNLQACSDKICLEPQTIRGVVPAVSADK